MDNDVIELKVNHCYYLLLPLLDLHSEVLSKVKSVCINNFYDRNSTNEFNKRIYIFFNTINDSVVDKISNNEHYIKTEYIDDELFIVSFKIPNNHLTDILLVTISEYTKTSKEYKQKILSYSLFKNQDTILSGLKRMLIPTEQDFIRKSEELMLDIPISKLTNELGTRFEPINETFHLSNFLNLKQEKTK